MSRYIATRAIRGANALVSEAEVMLQKALEERGISSVTKTIDIVFRNKAMYRLLSFLTVFLSPFIYQGRLNFLKLFLNKGKTRFSRPCTNAIT